MPIELIALGTATIVGVIGLNLSRFWPNAEHVPPVPFSNDAVRIIKRATHEARVRGSDLVTPEHILLALVGKSLSYASVQLVQQGIDVAALLEHLQGKHAIVARKRAQPRPIFTAGAKNVLVKAARAAFAARCEEAGPMHLLEGILQGKATHASRALRRAGVTLDVVRTRRQSDLIP